MEEKELELLYNDYAKDKGFKDFNEFRDLMSDEDVRKTFFDESNKDLGFKDYNEFNDLIFKKKSSAQNPFTDFLQSSSKEDLGPVRAEAAPVKKAKQPSENVIKSPRANAPHPWEANIKYKQEQAKKESDYKKSLVEYYDNAEAQFGEDQLASNPDLTWELFRDFSEKNGAGERIKYLQEKELTERPEEERSTGPLFDRGRQLLDPTKPTGAPENTDKPVSTRTGLQLKEEALSFRYSMLKEKKDEILKNKETQQSLETLKQLQEKISEKPDDQDLIDKYNTILQNPDIKKLNNIFKQDDLLTGEAKNLVATNKELFKERFDRLIKQEHIDELFAKGDYGVQTTGNQFFRAGTKFIGDILKLPSLFDGNNKYGPVDQWTELVDTTIDNINESVFMVPTDVNESMFKNDQNGNTTWRTDLIIPKTAKVAGDMTALLFGAGKVTGAAKAMGLSEKAAQGLGLFSSSYAQTFNEYKKEAINAGMNPDDAFWFAHTSSATQSALELLSPQKYLWANEPVNAAKAFAKNIKAGMNRVDAMKSAGVFTAKNIAAENIQEISQNVSDAAVRHYTNKVLDKEMFSNEDFFNQSLETMVLTSIVSGAPAVVAGGAQAANRQDIYNEAIRLVAEDKKRYMPLLQMVFKEQEIPTEQAQKIIDDVNSVPMPDAGQPMYIVDGEVASKEQVAKRIEEGNTQGIAVYNDPEMGKALTAKPRIRVKGEVVDSDLTVLATDQDVAKYLGEQNSEKNQRLGSVISTTRKVLSNLVPDLKVGLYNGDKKGAEIMQSIGANVEDSYGFYDPKSSTIYINEKDFKPDTPFHEAIHPIVNAVRQLAPERIDKFAKEAGAIKVEINDGNVVDYLSLNEGNHEEALVEFLGDFASNKFDESPTIIERVKKLVVDFLDSIGLPVADAGINLDNIDDLKEFAKSIATAFKAGKAVEVKGDVKATKETQSDGVQYSSKVVDNGKSIYTKAQTAKLPDVVSDLDHPVYGTLYKWWEKNKGTPVKMYGGRGDSQGIGFHNPANGDIHLNVNHSKFGEFFNSQDNVDMVIAHEIIHGIVDENVSRNPEAKVAFDSELESLRDTLKAQDISGLDEYTQRMIGHIMAGHPEEMITYGLTDPKIAAFFNTVKIGGKKGDNKTFWDKLKSLILGAVKASGDRTLLDSVTDVLNNYTEKFNDQIKEIKEPARAGNRLFNKPLAETSEIADRYFKGVFGKERPRYSGTKKIDSDRAKLISKAFEDMKHDPQNSEVKESYDAMIKETLDQYKVIADAGYSVEVNNEEPYANSQEMIDDLRENKRLKIFSTEAGFGGGAITDAQRSDNPLLAKTEYVDVNGVPLLANDIFRFVHDFFGHSELGNSFGPKGEENAWNVHARMYSPVARKAMTTETRGQNSYVNFSGVNEKIEGLRNQARILREAGNEAGAQKLVDEIFKIGSFAEQKIGLLPAEFYTIDETDTGDVQKSKKRSVEKMNQTAKRIAKDEQTIYKAIQKDILSNPQRYMYTPQDLKNKKLDLAAMSDQEVVQETESIDKLINNISFNNNFAVLSAIEAINRAVSQGKDARPIFDKMKVLGTSVGQLLRQFAELKTGTSQGIFNIVTKHLEAQNKQLTDDQSMKLQKLADDFIKSKVASDKAHTDFTANPSKQTDNALQKALNDQDAAFVALNDFVGKVTPMGIDSMIGTVLQGNLLTLKSVVANVAGNALFTPLRQVELMAGDLGAYIYNRMQGRNPLNPLEMWFGAALNGIRGFGQSIPKTAQNAVKGNTQGSSQLLEIRRGLHPLDAAWQILTKEGRKTLPVNAKGNIPLSLYMEKSLEATSGIPAELMFRLLYLGDAPFKDASRHASAYRIFAEQGGGSSADFRKFMLNMTDAQKELLNKRANEATFSDERTLAKIADKTLSSIKKSIDIATEFIPSKAFRDFVNTTVHVAQKANVPFVRVPANLVQYMLELTIPVIPLMGGLRYVKTDPRKASQLFARSATGFAFLYFADMLIEGGAVIAGGKDDKEEKKQLKYATAAPNTINVSAMRRIVLGIQDADNPIKEGDKFVDFSKLGIMGVALVSRAQLREKIKEGGQEYKELGFGTKQLETLNAGLRSSMELSFLQGTANLMDAVKDDGIQSYAAELGNTMSAVFIPNQVSSVTRARRDVMLRAKDKDILNNFIEKQSVKLFPALEDNVAGVYPVISMWGQPVQQNQGETGIHPYIRQFFDITNKSEIKDPVTVEIYNLSARTGEVPITAPSQSVTIFDADDNKVKVTLLEEDYTYLQMLAGQLKRMAVADLISEEDWKQATDEEKMRLISKENEYANSAARDYILGSIEGSIKDGKAVVDAKKKTYNYLNQQPFDYSGVEKYVDEELAQ